MILTEALSTGFNTRLIIEYKCGSVHRGYVRVIRGQYYLFFNRRSVVGTLIDPLRIRCIRFSLSRVKIYVPVTSPAYFAVNRV